MCNSSDRLLQECVVYFKSNRAYKRIFVELRKKWKKYGRVSGYINLENATEEEKSAIKALLGRAIEEEAIRFKMTEFKQALGETRYSGIGIVQLLEGYFEESLTTNKLEREKVSEDKRQFFMEIKALLEAKREYSEVVGAWLDNISQTKASGYQLIMGEYEKDRNKALRMVTDVCKAANYLKNHMENPIRLAVLSALISTQPHYFDRNRVEGRLLLYALCSLRHSDYPNDAEEILELYYSSGIIPDGISSYTAAYGISLYTDRGIHKSYEYFIAENESYLISLSNLNRIKRAEAIGKVVFIVENQMVFSQLCESMKGRKVSLMCTSGQLKTASLMLIDMLCRSGCTLYYSGDIDPEGIVIADKIIKRGKGQVLPWHFDIRDYFDSISDKDLDTSRLKKLGKVENPELQEVASEVLRLKKAGYQELFMNKLQEDIEIGVNMDSNIRN